MLNYKDILNKKFDTKFGGYNKHDVDRFFIEVGSKYGYLTSAKSFKQLKNKLANTGFNKQFRGYDGKEVTHFIHDIHDELSNPRTIKVLCANNQKAKRIFQKDNLLSVNDIHNKSFRVANHGYNMDQVNNFMSRIEDSYEYLYRENAKLKAKLRNQH